MFFYKLGFFSNTRLKFLQTYNKASVFKIGKFLKFYAVGIQLG